MNEFESSYLKNHVQEKDGNPILIATNKNNVNLNITTVGAIVGCS
jgi:hypothetical protein